MNCVQGRQQYARGVTCVCQGLGLLFGTLVYEVFHKDGSHWTSMKGNQGERLTCLESLKSRLTSVTGGAKAQMLCPQKVERVLVSARDGL